MLNRYLVPGCLVSLAMLTVVIPTLTPKALQPIASVQAAQTIKELQPKEIAAIAKATTVRIEASNGVAGSGVISSVYQEEEGGKNVYVVLTAKNLVEDKNATYNIITPVPQGSKEGRRLQIRISPKDIEELPDGNLAIVRFRTYHSYQTAELIEADEAEQAGLYVAGFPNPPQGSNKRVFHATEFWPDKSQTYSDLPVEYNFAGVMGGPVFDASGRVMNIYDTTNNQLKAIGKRRGFSLLRNYPKLRIRLNSTPPLLTLSLRDPNPLNVTEEIKPTDIDVVNE